MLCLRHCEKVANMFSIHIFPHPLASVKLRIGDLSVEMKSANTYMQMLFLPCNIHSSSPALLSSLTLAVSQNVPWSCRYIDDVDFILASKTPFYEPNCAMIMLISFFLSLLG